MCRRLRARNVRLGAETMRLQRLLLVGEHMLLLQGLKKLLEQQADIYATVHLNQADEAVRRSPPASAPTCMQPRPAHRRRPV